MRRILVALALAIGGAAIPVRAEPPLPGFVVHFDFISNVAEARALVRVAARQGAAVISIVPPAHVWEDRTALRMLDVVVADAGRLHLRILFSRIDAAYPPNAHGERVNYLYEKILSEPGRLPDGRATAAYFLTTAGRAGYVEWMLEETRYYAAHYGRLPNVIGFTLGPFVEPFASERGGFLQYEASTDRYELTQYTPEGEQLWHRWLASTWKRVEAVNEAYGASFSSIDRVPLPANELDRRFGAPQAAYTDFVRALNDWYIGAYRRCRDEWHRGGGGDVPFILQFSGFEPEKIAKGRPGLAGFDLPGWIAEADALALSLYSNGGYPDKGHASIAAAVRLLAAAHDRGKAVFVMEAGCEDPNVVADPRELAFLAGAAAPLSPRTWIYEFLKDKFDEEYAASPGKIVRADGRVRAGAAAAVREAFARVRAQRDGEEEPLLWIGVDPKAVRVDRQAALAANAMFALASAAPVRWVLPGDTERHPAFVKIGDAHQPGSLGALLASAPEPGTDERDAWIREVTERLKTAQPAPRDETAHAQAVLAWMAARDFSKVEAQFNQAMKSALPPGRLEAMWATLLIQAGPYKSCGANVRVRTIADRQMVITQCEFERAKVDLQIAFDADSRISGLALRPVAAPPPPYTMPPYATPASYTEGELTVGSTGWPLPATLDMPVGAGPFPAVVLVQGSGPNDRDETVGANKPFKDLALGLASRGIAVLRYDKRTKVYPQRLAGATDLTVRQEVVEDALEAVKTLRAQPRIDPSRIFVLGHSLGGMLIPRIAPGDPRIAGLIVMAGAARPLEDAIVEQTRYMAMADGTITPAEQARIDDAAKLAAEIKALTPPDAKSGRMILGAYPAYWLDLRGYDPPSAARGITQPLLVLQGERDYQVTMEEFAKWKAALAGKRNVTFRSYPSLNHLFIAGTGKSLPAEYEVPGHVAEDVIRDIAEWITLNKR